MAAHEVFRYDQFSGIKVKFMKVGLAVVLRKINVIQAVSCDPEKNMLSILPALDRNGRKVLTTQWN